MAFKRRSNEVKRKKNKIDRRRKKRQSKQNQRTVQQEQDTNTSPTPSTSQQDQDVPVASTSSSSNTTVEATTRTTRHVTYIDITRPHTETHTHVERTDIVFERVIRLPDAYCYVIALTKKAPCRVRTVYQSGRDSY
ncbi:hypothetical protein Pcinc_035538 [Petrolisthes cinctipes]|uniref:Uncharacterized protein n=1 Tax=Petrolisthes cinctipes TaxID=88211 RepID=A0AAE1BWD8_PETCI|nr:hypothetical protein Pcinc_035538 [Petrolisthes cinctipes]